MVKSKEWKWGFITTDGEYAIPPSYDGASGFSDGLAAVKVDWARGYIDHNGDFAIKPIYEAAGNFKDGIAVVKLEGENRCIDRAGNFISDIDISAAPSYETETGYNPRYEFHDGLVRFIENQKYGYKDKAGNVIIKPIYFDATDFSEGLACVKRGKTGLWGYIDVAGNVAIPAQFRQAQPFHEGLAAVLTAIE